LSTFVDDNDGLLKIKDTNGIVQPITDYTGGGASGAVIVQGTGTCSSVRCGVGNTASGNCSASLGGQNNCASGNFSFVGGGNANNTGTNSTYTSVVGGKGNLALGRFNFIGGGITSCISTSSGYYNMVVEIPMYSTAKMEVMKEVEGNPIMQDSKNNLPRYYSYGVPFFNYGLLPQTWEDPHVIDPDTGCGGDGDPIDAVEIGLNPLPMGSILPVKVLGSLALIDEGETDHKIIVLRSDDRNIDKINNMNDFERFYPGTTARLIDWMKNYKTTDGKPVNKLKSETVTTVDEAKHIINEVKSYYDKLISTSVRPSSAEDYYLPHYTSN
jgi:inorganic pyrophosphatase